MPDMASKEQFEVLVRVKLKRSEGKRQDESAFVEALMEDIEGIGTIWAADDEHDEESGYDIESAGVHTCGGPS
jgi:hypothetical protein